MLRARLLAALDEESSLDGTAAQVMRKRVLNLNNPTNRDKLNRTFEVVRVELRDNERRAIDHRNKLLHRGRLSDPRDELDDWKSVYAAEMSLLTAINKLFLRYLGYSGVLYDWGNGPHDSPVVQYALI